MVALPIAIYYGIIALTNSDFPIADDYHALLHFALVWQGAPDFVHRLQTALSFQHNEYKMPVQYLLLGTELSLTHQLNLTAWIWCGNLLILPILALLWKACAPECALNRRLWYFTPAVWMVANLNYAETVNFALSGMQEQLVVLLGLASLYLISRPFPLSNAMGCIAATLACGAYANAFLLAPAGALLLLHQGKRRVLWLWIACFMTALAPFLYHHHFVQHSHAGVISSILFLLNLVGSPFGLGGLTALSMLAAASLIALFGYAIYAKSYEVSPFAFSGTVWLFLGFFLVAYGRASGGYQAASASRYRIYSDLFAALLYLQFVSLYQRRRPTSGTSPRAGVTLSVAAIVMGLCGDALGYRLLQRRHDAAVMGIHNYVRSGGKRSPVLAPPGATPDQPRAAEGFDPLEEMNDVRAADLYTIPARYTR